MPALAGAGSLGTNKNIVIDTTAPTVTVTKVNGATRTFPYSTKVDVSSVGGTCTVATGDQTPITVTLQRRRHQSGDGDLLSERLDATLTTPISAENTYSVVASQSDLAGNN